MYDLSGVFVEITVFIITIIMDIVTLWAHQGLFSFASGFGSRVWLLHHFGCMAMTFGEVRVFRGQIIMSLLIL